MENTALSCQGFNVMAKYFCWEGIEHLEGKKLCSACGPTKYASGGPTEFGVWHGQFKRRYLPKGMFVTNNVGNLSHKELGEVDLKPYYSDMEYK
jgi:hypothetical protein